MAPVAMLRWALRKANEGARNNIMLMGFKQRTKNEKSRKENSDVKGIIERSVRSIFFPLFGTFALTRKCVYTLQIVNAFIHFK